MRPYHLATGGIDHAAVLLAPYAGAQVRQMTSLHAHDAVAQAGARIA